MNSLKKVLVSIYKWFLFLWHVNWVRTIRFNLKTMSMKNACHLPVLIYRGYVFDSLKGRVHFMCKPQFGLLKIGYDFDKSIYSNLRGRITLDGELFIYGYSHISKGVTMEIDGELHIHKNCWIGGGCFIKSLVLIDINENTRFTYNCTLFDCNMHYIKNIETGEVKNNRAPICIGKNCWINSGTVIMKGSVVPNYTITAKNTFIGKDYSEFGENLFLVGSPAKPTKSKVQRILSVKEQKRLNCIFKSGVDSVTLEPGLFEEDENELENEIKNMR